MISSNIPVITIDGPGSSGKGTIGHLLAQELDWHFLDSGVIYRGLALIALQKNVDLDKESELAELAAKLPIQCKADRVLLQNTDITHQIRSEECGNVASRIAVLPKVREALLERQRQFRQLPGLVTDGRDMGSVVFPDANVKFFLVASVEERARRRYLQLKEKGINVTLEALCEELARRDQRDQERVIAPLKPMPDAIILDTTGLSIEEVLRTVKEKVRELLSELVVRSP